MIWLTHLSELETFEALDDREFEMTGWTMHRTIGELLGSPISDKMEELTPEEGSPILRQWYDYVPYLGACHALFHAERVARLAAPGRVSTIPLHYRLGPTEAATRPPWRDDLDLLRSHRSNLARRFPDEYPRQWANGDMAMWPYIWAFSDDDGGYGLFISKQERDMLKRGDRKLPKSVKKRIENL